MDMSNIIGERVGNDVISHHDAPGRETKEFEEMNIILLLAIEEYEVEFLCAVEHRPRISQDEVDVRCKAKMGDGLPRFSLPLWLHFKGSDSARNLARGGGQGDGGESAGTADFEDAPGANARGQGAKEFGAHWLQIAVPLCQGKILLILAELSLPQAGNFPSFIFAQHRLTNLARDDKFAYSWPKKNSLAEAGLCG